MGWPLLCRPHPSYPSLPPRIYLTPILPALFSTVLSLRAIVLYRPCHSRKAGGWEVPPPALGLPRQLRARSCGGPCRRRPPPMYASLSPRLLSFLFSLHLAVSAPACHTVILSLTLIARSCWCRWRYTACDDAPYLLAAALPAASAPTAPLYRLAWCGVPGHATTSARPQPPAFLFNIALDPCADWLKFCFACPPLQAAISQIRKKRKTCFCSSPFVLVRAPAAHDTVPPRPAMHAPRQHRCARCPSVRVTPINLICSEA